MHSQNVIAASRAATAVYKEIHCTFGPGGRFGQAVKMHLHRPRCELLRPSGAPNEIEWPLDRLMNAARTSPEPTRKTPIAERIAREAVVRDAATDAPVCEGRKPHSFNIRLRHPLCSYTIRKPEKMSITPPSSARSGSREALSSRGRFAPSAGSVSPMRPQVM